jgi:ABC-type antimicrobial peptide transport system permease subunit
MAIRMALGAGVPQIGRRMLGSTLVVTTGGIVAGVLSGALLMRWAWTATGLPLRLHTGNVAATTLCVLAAVTLSALTPLRRVVTQPLTTVLND